MQPPAAADLADIEQRVFAKLRARGSGAAVARHPAASPPLAAAAAIAAVQADSTEALRLRVEAEVLTAEVAEAQAALRRASPRVSLLDFGSSSSLGRPSCDASPGKSGPSSDGLSSPPSLPAQGQRQARTARATRQPRRGAIEALLSMHKWLK